MAASVNNLGRAYCKVVLYDKLPNLVVNTSKMRKEYYLALGQLEDQQVYGNTSFGIQSVKVEGVQGNDSGGILPAICYEPVDNFINSCNEEYPLLSKRLLMICFWLSFSLASLSYSCLLNFTPSGGLFRNSTIEVACEIF